MNDHNRTVFSVKMIDISHVFGYLNQLAEIWDFPELLAGVYEGEEPIYQRLKEKFIEYEGEENREQVARKVRNWVHGRNLPGNREELFKVCFALGLDEEASGYILGTMADNGIHYRNPRELIYAFALRSHKDYPQAIDMVQRLWEGHLPSGALDYQKQMKESQLSEKSETMTSSIRNEFKRIRTEKELEQFLRKNKPYFGIHHNTAYRKFMKMMEYLQYPQYGIPDLPPEKEYTVERVVREYIRMDIPYKKQSKGYTRLQKLVKRHWPTAKAVHEMCSRKADVDRKTLLLLYLATEDMIQDGGAGEKMLQEHYRRIDLMLAECGMSILNLHSPFDYMVMESLNKENEDDFMSYRMEWMLHKLYRRNSKAAFITTKGEGHKNG